jgi:hypothetical protein
MTLYQVYLDDAFGNRLADASNFISLSYTRVVNDVGTLSLTLPGDFPMQYVVAPDGRIEVWRQLPNSTPYLDTDAVWLIKKVTQNINAKGLQTIVLDAVTPLHILREPGRFVNYAGGSAQAGYAAAPADNAIKQIARENIGTSASGSRNLSAYISIDGNLSQGASIAKSFAWRDCLKTMQEYADASTQAGTYCAFDIVAYAPTALAFRTFTQQRGMDHRFPNGINPVLFSPEMGNIGEITLTRDWSEEVTYALAAGQGADSSRLTASSQDNVRIGVSPFGLREFFVNATDYDTTTGLSNEAAAAVRRGRARQIFKGRILDTDDTQYGVQWAWGDYVTAQAFGQLIDCRIDAVTVSVQAGGNYETIDAWAKADE